MTLDAGKQARVVGNRARIRTGRTITVAAVYRTAYGGQQAVAVPLILKQQGTSNPATEDQTSTFANEYLAELSIEVDPRPIAYFALTGGSLDDAAIAAAIRLEVIEFRLSGLIANRWQLTLRRLR
jgi:gamma-glutamyltranspeptidase